jgi:long-chain acyl-CoA synthetase
VSDPLALLPLAIAAGGGRVGAFGADADFEAQQLIAAGLTLLQRSAPLVRALSGKRSALLLPTSPAFLTALAASDGRGAVLINPLAAPAEIAFQCHDANVGAIFTIASFVPRLPPHLPVVLLDESPRSARVIVDTRSYDVDLGAHHGLSIEGERDVEGRDEEAVIVYTSAMRGMPLGAVLTHRNLLANARATIDAMEIVSSDHVLAILPYAHLFGLTVTASAPLIAGARVTTMDRFNPVKAVEQLASGVTVITGVPAVYNAMLTAIERRGVRFEHTALRLCVCGGAVLPSELQHRWTEATGIELREGYGLTEAGPVCLFNRPSAPNTRGTLGVQFPGVDVAIFPPADYQHDVATPAADPLPDGESGEICVRGTNVSPGYLGGAHGLPRRGEWLYTGDEGVRDEEGRVTFLGLLKPMFTRNGFNVYPREIERVVGSMPGVTGVVCTPIPDPAKENDILLRVTGDVTEADVKRWCEQRLSMYKQPSVVEVLGR